VIAIVALAAAFISGAVASAIVLLRMGIAREESDKSLLDKPATRAVTMTRCVFSVYVRAPRRATEADDQTKSADRGQGQRPPTGGPGR
jgi:hypothetical protein